MNSLEFSSAYPSRALISRTAFAHNVDVVNHATQADVMAVVKADAYGHGAQRIGGWASELGISWLGVAQLGEALALREVIPQGRMLSWLYGPGAPFARAINAGIDLGVGSGWALKEVAEAARAIGSAARIHIKVDTGMSRGGFSLEHLHQAAPTIAKLRSEGAIETVGLWSHLACGDEAEAAFTGVQIDVFEQAREIVARAGIEIEILHLAASTGVLWHPQAHYDVVRPGIMLYGLSPAPSRASAQGLDLRPVMRLEADVVVTREVGEGTGVSYGHTYVTASKENLAVVPLGYADGIPREASNGVGVTINGTVAPIRGRICMDQLIVGAPGAKVGDSAILFGDSRDGYRTADDWGLETGTLGYEIVTRIGTRVPRISVD